MGEVFIWGLFNQVAINPFVWGHADRSRGRRAGAQIRTSRRCSTTSRAKHPSDGFRFGELSIADVAIACFFRNAAFARYEVDRARWPRTAAWVERTLALPAFAKLAAVRAEVGAHADPEAARGAGGDRRAAHRGELGHARRRGAA